MCRANDQPLIPHGLLNRNFALNKHGLQEWDPHN